MGLPGLRDLPPNARPKQPKWLDSAPSGGGTPVVEEAAPKRLGEVKQGPLTLEAYYVVKMHLREAIALPGMVGSMVGMYNLTTFNQGKIKPEMFGHYLGKFSITFSKQVKLGKLGQPSTRTTHSCVIPLKQSVKAQTSLKT